MSEGRLLAGRYELGPVLGRGGMAVVHRGRDQSTGREVAIKLVLDEASRPRFLAEARRTALIRHPSVVEVLDSGEDGDQAFLVMELLEGEPLSAALDREGSLPPAEAVRIACRVLDALGASHALGIVHRDIKPPNVFLSSAANGEPPRVTVLDFGVAKRIDGSTVETEPGTLVGTFAYMSPEQIRGGEIDGRSDLYSLGVLLYRMLGGRQPFEQDTAASLIHAHLTIEAPHLPGHASDPEQGRLDAVVRRLLSKQPSARPGDAAAARAALETAVLAGAPSDVVLPALEPLDSPTPAPRAEAPPSAAAPALELAEDVAPAHFEIDHRPAPVLAPRPGITVPRMPPVSLGQDPRAWGPRPGELAPAPPRGLLASVPPGVSKRVAAYAVLGFLVAWFFGASWPWLLGLVAVAVLGAVAYAAAPHAPNAPNAPSSGQRRP